IIESLPVSPIPVEDSDPVQEEIDIFLIPDDLIPPGVENDDSKDEDSEFPNLDHQDNPSSPRPPLKLPDVCLNSKPATAMRSKDFNQEEIVLSLNVEDVNSFTFVIWTFLSFFTYHEDSPVILSLRRIESSLRLGEQKQAASWECTPCLSELKSPLSVINTSKAFLKLIFKFQLMLPSLKVLKK
ncbi:hypothetical protein Tco_0187114, partial [Tanacetum coccineum]